MGALDVDAGLVVENQAGPDHNDDHDDDHDDDYDGGLITCLDTGGGMRGDNHKLHDRDCRRSCTSRAPVIRMIMMIMMTMLIMTKTMTIKMLPTV